MFESTNQEILASLRDFIGDALSESEISPTDIVEAIQEELDKMAAASDRIEMLEVFDTYDI